MNTRTLAAVLKRIEQHEKQMELGTALRLAPEVDETTATGWFGDLLAQLEGASGFEPLARRGIPRHAPAVPGARLFLARVPPPVGPRRLPGRRHGPRQDHPDPRPAAARAGGRDARRPDAADLPDVGRRQLAAGGRPASRPACRCCVHHGAEPRRAAPTFRRGRAQHDLVITSYALLHRDVEHLAEVAWRRLVSTRRRTSRTRRPSRPGRSARLPAGYRIALTGTPVENHVGELWSIMEFLNPGLLGTPAEFARSFAVPIERARRRRGGRRAAPQLTGPFMLRRLKTDKSIIADLPDKLEMKVYCTLTREQATLYQAVVDEMLEPIERADGHPAPRARAAPR